MRRILAAMVTGLAVAGGLLWYKRWLERPFVVRLA